MREAVMRRMLFLLPLFLVLASTVQGADSPAELARKAHAILKTSCHRCHGQNGSLEGGFNSLPDHDKLLARKKILPGQADQSPLYKRIAAGKMPPAGEAPRPTVAEVALLKQWIDSGAPG